MNSKVKVLISEDHALFRDGLRLMLADVFGDVEILESANFETTRQILSSHNDISLVLFDIHMPGTTGLCGLEEVKRLYPALPLVVVSATDNHFSIQKMIQLGADGFIAKSCSKEDMVNSLHRVAAGELVVVAENGPGRSVHISPRQIETLELMAKGMTNKEIADVMSIAPSTVKEYVSDILNRLECENRTQAVIKSRDLGIFL